MLPHAKPFLTVDPEQPLVVQPHALPRQQDVQPPVPEPPPLGCKHAKPGPHVMIGSPTGPVAIGLRRDPNQQTGQPL